MVPFNWKKETGMFLSSVSACNTKLTAAYEASNFTWPGRLILALLVLLLMFFALFVAAFYCLLMHPELAKQGFEKALSMSSSIEKISDRSAEQEHNGNIVLQTKSAGELPQVVIAEDAGDLPKVVDKYFADENLVEEHFVEKHLVEEHLVEEHVIPSKSDSTELPVYLQYDEGDDCAGKDSLLISTCSPL